MCVSWQACLSGLRECGMRTSDKGVKIIVTARDEDDLRRASGNWQFARRKLHQDMPEPAKA